MKFACASGACKASLEGVKTGKYTFTLCDASGKVLMKAKEKANREPSPGATTESISINFTKITFIYDVVVTGNGSVSGAKDGVHPDGKRQHTNIIINKRLSPGEGFVTTGDVNGDGRLDLSFSWTSSNGGISALDDWEAPSVH